MMTYSNSELALQAAAGDDEALASLQRRLFMREQEMQNALSNARPGTPWARQSLASASAYLNEVEELQSLLARLS